MSRNGRCCEAEREGQGVFPQGLPKEEMYGGVEIQPQLEEKFFGFGGQFRIQMEMFRHGKLAGSAFWFHDVPLLPRRAVKSRALAGFAAILIIWDSMATDLGESSRMSFISSTG